MQFEDLSRVVCLVLFWQGLSLSPVLIVWLGMMLVSPSTLVGLSEDRIQRMTRLRRGFARLIFRGLLWFVAILPVVSLIWLGSYTKIMAPIAGETFIVLIFGTWWLYVVVGSLAHAWIALSIMEEGERQ